jgi:hypothetical protein
MHEDDRQESKLFKGGRSPPPLTGLDNIQGGSSCPSGYNRREGYVATRKKKSFIGRLLKRGTTYRVKPSCVKDRGSPGKSLAVIGPLKQGDLTSKGYSSKDSASVRHAAIAKAVGAYGRLSTLRKLNAIAVLNKNTSPARAKTFKTDRNWVKKTYF